jgi:outer membrane protein assembly factor BamB
LIAATIFERWRAWVLVVGAVVAGGSSGGAFAADPPSAARPEFAVTSFDLGTVPQEKATGQQLADELNRAEWCAARPVAAASWHDVPAGVDPRQWLSVVVVGFGEQAQAYAFQFDGPGGSARLASHVAHRKRFVRGILTWTNPFARLLNGVRTSYERRESDARPRLQLEFADLPAEAKPRASAAPKSSLDDALTLTPEKVLPPVKAIVVAAACEAGWAPLLASAKSSTAAAPMSDVATARVEIGVRDQACAFRLTIAHAGRTYTLAKDRIPWEEYHDQLARLFRSPLGDAHVADFIRVNPVDARLLTVAGDRLACIVDDELAVVDAPTGRETWRIRIPQSPLPTAKKKIESYTTRPGPEGRPRLFRWTTSLAEIAWDDGKPTVLAPAAAGGPTLFDVDAKGHVALVSGKKLSYYTAGSEAWSVEESHAIACGPLLETSDAGGTVLFGNDKGELVAVAAADGRVLRRTPLGGRLYGPIVRTGSLRLAFSNEDERLSAVDSADGAVKWTFATGDVLLQPPLVLHGDGKEGDVVLVTKQNRLVRLNAATGNVAADVRRPRWLVAVESMTIDGRVQLAASDVGGEVVLLGDDLQPVWQARLNARRTGTLAALRLPATWQAPVKPSGDDILSAIESDGTKKQWYLLSTDARGFLDKLTLEGVK